MLVVLDFLKGDKDSEYHRVVQQQACQIVVVADRPL